MHTLCAALPVTFVNVWVTCGVLVTHFYIMHPLTAEPHSVYLWNNFGESMFDAVGLAGLKRRVNASMLA